MGKGRKPNFQAGAKVVERAKPHRNGVINRHERTEGRRYMWVVEFLQADGSTVEEVMTSMQLKFPPEVEHPTVPETVAQADTVLNLVNTVNSFSTSNEVMAEPPARGARSVPHTHNEMIAPTATRGGAMYMPSTTVSPPASSASSTSSNLVSIHSSDSCSSSGSNSIHNNNDVPEYFDWSKHVAPDKDEEVFSDDSSSIAGEEDDDEARTSWRVDDNDSDNDSDDSLLVCENETNETASETVSETLSNDPDNPNGASEDIESEDERDFEFEEEHRQKKLLYDAEKARLLSDKWSVAMDPDKPAFGPGARVYTKGRNRRNGTIDRRDPDGVKWLVNFTDSQGLEVASFQALVLDWTPTPYVWNIVEKSEPNKVAEKYRDVGLIGFDFDEFDAEKSAKKSPTYRYPYLRLLQKLWPGDWRMQLRQLNERLDFLNKESREKALEKGKTNRRMISHVSENEWWKFIGILVAAAAFRVGGGELLFEKDEHRDEWTITEPINLGLGGLEIMPAYRFKDLRANFPYAFRDQGAEAEGDPWHMIRLLSVGFNDNRRQWIAASEVKVMDESMSAYRPQTSPKGNLPHLSFILRKPEPLGTELKTVACPATGVIIFAEIQEGAQAMKNKKFGEDFGGTAACTFRLAEGTSYCGLKLPSRTDAMANGATEYFNGDSWFTSIPVAEGFAEKGLEYVGAMKTNHKLFPKDKIEEKMQNWPSGSHIVLECQTPKGHTLLAIGYKYNRKKTLCFLATKNAGSTMPGNPYEAKFPDSVGNVCVREVERPAVISEYFANSNCIDSHNHVRQGELMLEKRWVTRNGWFRLATTYIGMTVTDAWKLFKHGVADTRQTDITILQFADRMAADLCRNMETTSKTGNLNITCPSNDDDLPIAEVNAGNRRPAEISPVSVFSIDSTVDDHHFKDNSDREDEGCGRPKRRTCRAPGCRKATQKKCQHPICRNFTYRVNSKVTKGVFYCPDHWKEHHKEVHSGSFFTD
jgi:hypothetical protein